MSLNHLASKNLHGNFASLKVNDVTIGGSGKQHIHFSANLNSNGVNFLNAFSKGSGGSVANVLHQYPPLANIKITGLFANRKNPNPNVMIILQKANLVLNENTFADLYTLVLVPGTVIDSRNNLNIPVGESDTVLVKIQSDGAGTVDDIQVIVTYERV